MGIFDKRKTPAPPSELPFTQVRAMKAQGYTNNQIIQSLQRDGFTSSQIFDALNGVEQGAGPVEEQQPMEQPMPEYQQYAEPQQPMPPPPLQQQYAAAAPASEDVEELVETIIDEKWNELVKDISKIIDWKNKTENRMTQLEQQFTDLKADFDKVHAAILGKIGEYDKNILEVGAEIKAMEKVFSKVLPQFTDNVNELSRITESFKKKP
ncbi:MAG: hypothetical protein V1725_02965 [archaeon]